MHQLHQRKSAVLILSRPMVMVMMVVTAAMKRVAIKRTVTAVACLFTNSLYLNLAISRDDSNGFIFNPDVGKRDISPANVLISRRMMARVSTAANKGKSLRYSIFLLC